MSNLKDLLRKRRSKFYEGDTLQKHCDDFMRMVQNAVVHDFNDTIIVLEPHGLRGNFRAWLLFDKFSRDTVRAMQNVISCFDGIAIYASTHDNRIAHLLQKLGFSQYANDNSDYYLVYRK